MTNKLKTVITLLVLVSLSIQEGLPNEKRVLASTQESESIIKEFQKLLKQGNISQIDAYLKNLLSFNSYECNAKKYIVSNLVSALNKLIITKQKQISSIGQNQNSFGGVSPNFKGVNNLIEAKKNLINEKSMSQQRAKEMEKQIASINSKRQTQLLIQYIRALDSMKKNQNNKQNAKQQAAINKLNEEMRKLDEMINQVRSKRENAKKNIISLRLSVLQNNKIQQSNPDQLQKKINQYTELAIQAKIKLDDKKQQLAKLKLKLSSKQKNLFPVETQILKAKQDLEAFKKQKNGKSFAQLLDVNDMLQTISDSLEGRIMNTLKQCPN